MGGFMGHITRISNTVVNHAHIDATKTEPYLMQCCETTEKWAEYEKGPLEESNERFNFQLGGQKPNLNPLQSGEDVMEDDGLEGDSWDDLFSAKGDPFSFDPPMNGLSIDFDDNDEDEYGNADEEEVIPPPPPEKEKEEVISPETPEEKTGSQPEEEDENQMDTSTEDSLLT